MDGSRAALPAPVERIRAFVSRVKQEGGRAALMCLLSQSTLEREFWLGELPGAGFATNVRRDASRQAESPGHMRTGLTRRDSTAVGLSGTALRLDVLQTNRGAGSAASSSRMHPAAVFSQPAFSAQQNVQAAQSSKTARLSSKLRQTAVVASQALEAPDNRVGCLTL
ncbi:hypothetical protein [Burkholderia sp. PAMC 26561]|uniref:hypothetical protein n=1 Tax=Burkholderia sp. PAMC 26561 TaxID=1795043 RepID=UPI0013C404E9|nr:hypothetical protein [Burkholderia sp. PAMC 26561]